MGRVLATADRILKSKIPPLEFPTNPRQYPAVVTNRTWRKTRHSQQGLADLAINPEVRVNGGLRGVKSQDGGVRREHRMTPFVLDVTESH